MHFPGVRIINRTWLLPGSLFFCVMVYNWCMEKQLSGKAMEKFPDYKTVSVSSLIPYARNSRTHSDAQVGQIAASIKEFGFLNPIIVDGESGIIAGHGRVLAAQKLGLAELPVIEAGHLSDAQRRAYIIADNKLAMNASWDDEMLRVELDALGVDGFDLELTGFSLDDVATLLIDGSDFEPGSEDDQGQLDKLDPKIVTCPHCSQEFDSREQG